MKLSKEELAEELEHQLEMLRLLRRRRRERERQAAQYGLEIPPHIATEINALNDQIRERESEIMNLETLSAEGQLSLAEAEYRVLLAEGLSKSDGRLTYLEITRLESARLKSGLLLETAKKLEDEVRRELCEEDFAALSDDVIAAFSDNLMREKTLLKKHMIANSSDNQIEQNSQIMELTNARLNRLFYIERQKTIQGVDTPAHILMDIDELRKEIIRSFDRFGIAHLYISEDESVEDIKDKFNLLGVEVGKLNKLLKEREELIEIEFNDSDLAAHTAQKFGNDFRVLSLCVRLDPKTTARLLHRKLEDCRHFPVDIFYTSAMFSLKIKQSDHIKFEEFLNELKQLIANTEAKSDQFTS